MMISTTDGKIILIPEITYDKNPTTAVKLENVLVIETIRTPFDESDSIKDVMTSVTSDKIKFISDTVMLNTQPLELNLNLSL